MGLDPDTFKPPTSVPDNSTISEYGGQPYQTPVFTPQQAEMQRDQAIATAAHAFTSLCYQLSLYVEKLANPLVSSDD